MDDQEVVETDIHGSGIHGRIDSNTGVYGKKRSKLYRHNNQNGQA